MHPSALRHAELFFRTYVTDAADRTIVDLGSRDVNGSLRSVAPPGARYVGVDFQPGNGVDVVLDDPYRFPFADGSVDVVVSSSCFEHSEFFWESFCEAIRILKPTGLFYLNAPSNGMFHRHPVDCWRFYPDSGLALRNWARRKGQPVELLESFTGNRGGGQWSDFVAVFVKDAACAEAHPARMLDSYSDFTNGRRLGSHELLQFRKHPQEGTTRVQRMLALLTRRTSGG